MSKADYYQTLGVARDADKATIKQSYRRLAMKYHPDRNPDDKTAEDKFKTVQEAYDVLSDPQKKEAYDRFGHAAFDGAGPGPGGGDFSSVFDDLFSDFFGGNRSRQRQEQPRQRVLSIRLSFEESINGCHKEIKLTDPIDCDACHGSGAEPGSRPTDCDTCHGSGQIRINRGPFIMQQTCGTCGGSGKIISSPCHRCQGSGSRRNSRKVSVKIPAGIQDGETIRLNVDGGGRIQYYLRAHVDSHPLFERDGDNLHISIPVSMAVAALGGHVEAPTPSGGKIKITVPPETQTGAILRLRGRGAPSPRGLPAGDMLCHILLETPVNLTEKQKNLLRDFDDSLKKKHSRHSPREKSWLEKAKELFADD